MGTTLSARQLQFIQEYLIDRNATQAAIRAGYRKTGAQAQGSRLLSNLIIKDLIEKGLTEQLEKTKDKAEDIGVTKERWIKELALLAFANMDDFVIIEKKKMKNGLGGKTYEAVMVTAKATCDRSPTLGRVIKKISETKNGIGIELHNKQAALDTLGKHFGWVSNDTNLNLPANAKVVLTMPANGSEAPPDEEVTAEVLPTEVSEAGNGSD